MCHCVGTGVSAALVAAMTHALVMGSRVFGMQGFLTAVLQNHARLTQTPIDQIKFGFRVMQEQEAQQLASAPSSGAYLSGLHLEGARYDF